jgi:hypothetical protein
MHPLANPLWQDLAEFAQVLAGARMVLYQVDDYNQ